MITLANQRCLDLQIINLEVLQERRETKVGGRSRELRNIRKRAAAADSFAFRKLQAGVMHNHLPQSVLCALQIIVPLYTLRPQHKSPLSEASQTKWWIFFSWRVQNRQPRESKVLSSNRVVVINLCSWRNKLLPKITNLYFGFFLTFSNIKNNHI